MKTIIIFLLFCLSGTTYATTLVDTCIIQKQAAIIVKRKAQIPFPKECYRDTLEQSYAVPIDIQIDSHWITIQGYIEANGTSTSEAVVIIYLSDVNEEIRYEHLDVHFQNKEMNKKFCNELWSKVESIKVRHKKL